MSYFNEIFTADGQVRPHYAGVYDYWKSMPPKKHRSLHAQSKRLFSGDYAQDPFPRILTQNEFAFLSKGVEQRARAVLAFLYDYCTAGARWNRVMPASTLHSMIERHHVVNTLKELKPDQLVFPYGPDIIRDRTDQWRVVEDSAGMIGGIGDLLQSHKILYKLIPGFRKVFSSSLGDLNHPKDFYHQLALHFSQMAKKNDGIPLLYLRPYAYESDQETRRLAQIFAGFGIGSTTPSNRLKKIQIKEGKDAGIFLKTKTGRQRIGALIFHANPEQLDESGIRIDMKLMRVFVSNAPSLKTALLNGYAWTNFSPGTRFINDKIFGLYVDRMIRHFLKETPLLKSIAARPMAVRRRNGAWQLDRSMITALRRNKDHHVVKQVDEDGGSGVWIGQKESRRSMDALVEKLRCEPEKFIIQDFEHLSVLDNRIVDLRLHAHVDSERIIVSNTPWGRANWIHDNGKVNIGSNGFTSPVVVVQK